MRHFPIYEQKYIDLIRYAEGDDRLGYALSFIDEVLSVFIRYGNQCKGQELFSICRQGLKAWKKICRYEIVIHKDEEGYEYLLEPKTFTDYMLDRFLRTAKSEAEFKQMSTTLKKIFDYLGWEYEQIGSYEELCEGVNNY